MKRTPHARVRPRSPSESTQEQLRLLIDTGLLLASERDLDVIVQGALDAALRLCGAHFGAFFYNNIGDDGEIFQLYKASAADAAFLADSGPSAPTEAFVSIFLRNPSSGIQRFDDLTQLPPTLTASRFGNGVPFPGMRSGHAPVRSLLAVPVRSPGGELLGGMLHGHLGAAAFDPVCEELVATIASQSAVAIENARLAVTLSREIALADAARQLQRETASRLHQALDAAELGTWSWERATDLIDLDERAAQLFRTVPHARVTRSSLRDRVILAEDRDVTVRSLQHALESGGFYAAEYRVGGPGEEQTWISARGIATFTPGSTEISGMVGTVQDITVRRNSEAALRQSEKLAVTGRFAASIAHEINNPLEIITNLIYLSKTDPGVPPSVRELLESADHELAAVAELAQQTLGFYRDTGQPVEIDINQLLERSLNLFTRKMQSRHIVCHLDLAPDLRVFGLPGEIRQVVSNLLINAIDASLSTGVIHIRARRRVRNGIEGVSILIADSGAGIPANLRPRLFAPFFTTKESAGTGLGLWLSRGLVEKHGGVISFRSRTEPPSGTVFRIFLPRTK